MKAIEMAVTRQKYGQKEDRVLEEKTERVTVRQAVEAYTINAAYQLHMEEKLGSLEEGKYADLIVLDQDIFQCDPYDIHKTRILMTVFNGEVVYDALGKEGSK